MSLNIKKILSFNFKKKKSNYEISYKYDDIINNEIKKINKKDEKDKPNLYKIGEYKVNRKIPDKNDLSKIYDKFLRKRNIISKDNKFNYSKIIKNLILLPYNQFILIKLDLNKIKRYWLSISFQVENISNIIFLFNNNITKIQYNIDEVMNSVLFNTNDKNISEYTELYVIFNKQDYISIKNININIKEITNNDDYSISLIKFNNKVNIF